MSCDRCGSPTSRSRLCATCGQIAALDDQAMAQDVPDCPQCGGSTSREGLPCGHCQRGQPSPTAHRRQLQSIQKRAAHAAEQYGPGSLLEEGPA